MCRLLAYWGPAVPIAELIVDPPHSLLRQCTAARLQSSGTDNPDGWGFGYYTADSRSPVRYRASVPMPVDATGLAGLDGIRADRFVAHVRHKSPGSPTEVAGNAPFVEGPWLFAHNGFVADYLEGVGETLRQMLSPARRERLHGHADSELLFGLILDGIDAGAKPVEAMHDLIEPLSGPGRDRGRFNFLLTDGDQLVASRWGNSLHLRTDHGPAGSSVIVASEPFDDRPGWDAVPDHTLMRIDAGGVELIAH